MNDRLFHLRHWMYHLVEDRLTVSVCSKINGPAKDNIIYCCALHAEGLQAVMFILGQSLCPWS